MLPLSMHFLHSWLSAARAYITLGETLTHSPGSPNNTENYFIESQLLNKIQLGNKMWTQYLQWQHG